ncbi:hypothetical protein EYC98_14125 [Halieaceae bacterium IMCC14734]|uniref:Uncharacterized protein n=1 Tax=Candidatus Litorirhabdus singularis TaxID=2518993 RepID=A0ABT3TI85_9GAMM|nr:hypothetical protein [Candidatus Litorirhabdus singularis]MCX2981996.1 hypothetical protein [Candidatus Litorirhabdus singularis]
MDAVDTEQPATAEAAPEQTTAASATLQLTDSQKLIKHGLIQGSIALAAFSMWAATDAWLAVTQLPLANLLSILTAIIAGVTVSTVIHEWFHFAGAKLGGSRYTIPTQTGFFVYDYNYADSSVRQFYIMSLAGQLGSVVAIVGFYTLIPLDTSGRFMLLAAAIGSALFGGAIEWPVMLRTRHSHNPLAELSKITPRVFNRSLSFGLFSGLLVFFSFA